jgi:hypothetical protein
MPFGEDLSDMGHEQGPAKSVCGAMRRQALRRLRGEQEAELGIGLGRRDGDEDAGLRAQRACAARASRRAMLACSRAFDRCASA